MPLFYTLNWHPLYLIAINKHATGCDSNNPRVEILMHLSANADTHKNLHPPTHSRYTGAVYPNGGRDVGPCRPMSVFEEAKYFHCQGICSCQQSDVCTRLRYAVPMRPVASAAGRWGWGGGCGIGCSQISGTWWVSTHPEGQIEWGQDVTDVWWFHNGAIHVTFFNVVKQINYDTLT